MSNTFKFDNPNPDPEAVQKVLQSLSDYFIPLSRLKIRETTLGEGGFGTVKLADLWRGTSAWQRFRETPNTVAVKELHHTRIGPRIGFRFAREIKVWAACDHPNILKFTGFHLSKDFQRAYLVSPYMKHGNVKDYLVRAEPSLLQRFRLVLGTIYGLEYLHSRDPPIVHGDLKPLNVLVNDNGDTLLSDFGLARALEDGPTGLTTSDGFKGTLRYCSLEVLNGIRPDIPSDIWAWGCLALEVSPIGFPLTGIPLDTHKNIQNEKMVTGIEPYHECQSDGQIWALRYGTETRHRTPEPSDSSSIHRGFLHLLAECWSLESSQRPDAEQCASELELFLENRQLPWDLCIPQKRLRFSTQPEYPINPFGDAPVAQIVSMGRNEGVRVRVKSMPSKKSSREFLAQAIHNYSTHTHGNLVELVGISLNLGRKTIDLLWLYTRSENLFEHLTGRHTGQMGRLHLLRGILMGLQHLHSRPVNVVHGALSPWTIFVDDRGTAVLSDISFGVLPNVGLWDKYSSYTIWCSPETVYGRRMTPGSDIWSCACIALQVLLAQEPLNVYALGYYYWSISNTTPEPMSEARLPAKGRELLRRCWLKDSNMRPSASACLDLVDPGFWEYDCCD